MSARVEIRGEMPEYPKGRTYSIVVEGGGDNPSKVAVQQQVALLDADRELRVRKPAKTKYSLVTAEVYEDEDISKWGIKIKGNDGVLLIKHAPVYSKKDRAERDAWEYANLIRTVVDSLR